MITSRQLHVGEPSVGASISDLTHDAIELAELQAQLFACDVKSSGRRARNSLILFIIGVCTLLSSFPVMLMAFAMWLNAQVGWAPSTGYAVAAVAGLVVSTMILGFAYAKFKEGVVTLEQSRDELGRNIEWLKAQLSRSHSRTNQPTSF